MIACADATPVFDIPRVDNITIDGNTEDWGTQGYQARIMLGQNGGIKPVADFDPSFHLGWNKHKKGVKALLPIKS